MLVDFIIPTFSRINELRSMLSSLVAQTDGDWQAHVIVDDTQNDAILSLAGSFRDNRIKVSFMDKRYNDWGHTPREWGKNQSDAMYVIMTGDDNYYTPNFVSELRQAAETIPGMIYWDMVHSHYKYAYFRCYPAYNQIDMGAFATRTNLAKKVELGKEYAADGLYVENFKKKFPNEEIIKIDKVLFVHN